MSDDNTGMDATLHELAQKRGRRGRPLRDFETLDLFSGEPSRQPPRPYRPSKQAERLLELILSREWVWETGLASTPPEGVPSGNVKNILAALARAGFIERRLPEQEVAGLASQNLRICPTEKARAWLREKREKDQPEKVAQATDTETIPIPMGGGRDWMLKRIRILAKKNDIVSVSLFFSDLGRYPGYPDEMLEVSVAMGEAASRGWTRKLPGKRERFGEVYHPVYKSLIHQGAR